MKKHIVVTGSHGFIGKHLVEALNAFYRPQNHGDEVICTLIDLENGKDILEVEIPKCDVLFHLAAQTDVQASIQDPMHDAMTNIAGTIKVLLENPSAKVIICGSAASMEPQSPYGASKLAQAAYAVVLHKNVVVCVLPNVFGEGSKGVVQKFIDNTAIVVNGDGEQTRDFVHVDDVVVALMRAEDWAPGVYMLGSGTGVSIKKLAETTGKQVLYDKALPGEIRESVLDSTAPDWKPAINVIDYLYERTHEASSEA